MGSGLRAEGSWFRVQGLGVGVYGSGDRAVASRVMKSGLRLDRIGFTGSGLRVESSGLTQNF